MLQPLFGAFLHSLLFASHTHNLCPLHLDPAIHSPDFPL